MRILPGIVAILLLAAGVSRAASFESPSTGYLLPSYGYESVIADFNGDGLPDIASASSTPGKKIVVFRNLGGRRFVAMDTLVATGDGGIAVGDLNADGHLDLAAEAAGKTSVWLGNGDFTFGARTDFTIVATSGRGTAVGDVVGDGLPDVVAPDSVNVLIVWRSTGGGGLVKQRSLAISGRVDQVRLVDLDHDGDLDVVDFETACSGCSPQTYQVRVIRNLGGGAFSNGTVYATGTGTGLSVADVDGDTHPDILAGAYKLKGLGNGTFNAPALYGSASEFAPCPGDLDQDGITDLVTRIQFAKSGTPTLPDSMLIHLGTGGGTFAPGVVVPTGNAPLDFDVADLDGDTHPDVVATCSAIAQIVVHWGDGAGGFGPRREFAAGGRVERVGVADVTGDGIPDVLALSPSGNRLRLLSGQGGGDFAFLQDVTTPASAVNFAVGDFNHDTHLDVALITTGALWVYPGLGAGGVGPGVSYALPATGNDLAAGDVTGDGVDDVLVSGISVGTLSLFAGIADSSGLATRVDYSTPFTANTRVAIANSNADPYPDVVLFGSVSDDVYTRVYPGQPGGGLGAPIATYLASFKGSYEHDLADLNGDGAPETVSIIGSTTTSYAWIFFANLDGTYVLPPGGVPESITLGRGAQRMAYADFDHDGFTDIAACQQLASGIAVFAQLPNADFGDATIYGATRQPYAVAAADLNGDGWADIVAGERLSQTVNVLLNDPPVVTAVPGPPPARATDFTITRVWPTVARDRLNLEFVAPAAGPLQVEAFDVAGRRLFARSPGAVAPGVQRLALDLPRGLPPGLMWLRLRQGSRVATARAIVAR